MPRNLLPRALGMSLLCLCAAAQAGLRYKIQDLGRPPGIDETTLIAPKGLNHHGEAVGVWDGDVFVTQSFFYRNGRMEWLRSGQTAKVYANALNDRGQVVGVMDDAQGRPVPFLYAGGRFQELAGSLRARGPGGALDINAAGQVVGYRGSTAFIFDGTRAHAIDVPGISGESLLRINDHGVVAGVGWLPSVPSGERRVFLHNAGRTSVLAPLPPATVDVAVTDFNNAGQLALLTFHNGPTRSYVWEDGRYTLVRGLSAWPDTVLHGLNDQGWGVGSSIDSIPGHGIRYEAFLWRDGRTVNLNELVRAEDAQRWSLRDATAINNRGQITGYGYLDGGLFPHAFLATPVPEPAGAALLLAGLALTGAAARRRRPGQAG